MRRDSAVVVAVVAAVMAAVVVVVVAVDERVILRVNTVTTSDVDDESALLAVADGASATATVTATDDDDDVNTEAKADIRATVHTHSHTYTQARTHRRFVGTGGRVQAMTALAAVGAFVSLPPGLPASARCSAALGHAATERAVRVGRCPPRPTRRLLLPTTGRLSSSSSSSLARPVTSARPAPRGAGQPRPGLRRVYVLVCASAASSPSSRPSPPPPPPLTVLVVGAGGREHALCDAIARSPRVAALLCAPGNAGVASVARCVPDVVAEDVPALLALVERESVDFVVVGPEAPLVGGLVDALGARGVPVFGPSQRAAMLEGSKAFSKQFMTRHGIPTAFFGRFADASSAKAYVREQRRYPIVVKADGLAAGKGVIIAQDEREAFAAIDDMLELGVFGAAGDEVIVEEYLRGEEASFFAIVDGEHAVPLVSAQDHKPAHDGDKGPNTGGMGAYTPAPVVTPQLANEIMERVVRRTARGMARDGTPFRGVLYCGMMIAPDGGIKVLEYNVRFGDPECQALCALVKSDLLQVLYDAACGNLGEWEARGGLEWHDGAAMTVVMAAEGYPGKYEKGTVIGGLAEADAVAGARVYHAGTARDAAGRLVASGGRVLGVTARGATIAEARARAYESVHKVQWPGGFYRSDIGWRAVGEPTPARQA